MTQGIRDWATTILMGLIEIIVTIGLKNQHQGTRELAVKFSVSYARGGI